MENSFIRTVNRSFRTATSPGEATGLNSRAELKGLLMELAGFIEIIAGTALSRVEGLTGDG
jgi:hypothetical protein